MQSIMLFLINIPYKIHATINKITNNVNNKNVT